jgi:hypothetical protein
MKFFLTLLTSLFISASSSAQSVQVEEELNSSYYEFEGFEINLTSNQINFSKNNQDVYFKSINGKKVFKLSLGDNFFLIANFQFSEQKKDYPVEIDVFDRNASLVFSYEFLAPYDLPHPLFCVNDNGVLALFDPLNFKIKLITIESENDIELEKEIPFEMERASFIEANNDFLFILTSLNTLDITETGRNVGLYKVNLEKLSFDKRYLDYNTPTLLEINDNNVFISGVKFENLKPIGKTIKYDFELNQLSSNDKIIEKLIPNGNNFYAKYLNVIYDLSNDLYISNEKQLSEGEIILNLGIWDDKLIVVTNISGENNLYYFFPGLNVDFKVALHNFGVNKIEDLSILENIVVIRHDSKSVKIKTNRN